MKKHLMSLAVVVALTNPFFAHARGGPSEASAVSILATGSVVLAMSTLPLIALDSIFDASVGKVQKTGNNMTDIEILQKNSNKVAVIRVPDATLNETTITTGQKADLIADPNGHTLRIDGKPMAYVPGKSADGLMHSKPIK